MEEKTGDVMGNTHRKSVRLNREGKKSARWDQVQVRKTTRRQKKEDSSCKLMVKLTAAEQQNQSEKTERGEKGGRKRERSVHWVEKVRRSISPQPGFSGCRRINNSVKQILTRTD